MEFLSCPELENFMDAADGAVYKSKAPYLTLLPNLYEAIAEMSTEQSTDSLVGSFTYDGWSSKLGSPIAGLPFHFVDSQWLMKKIPISILNTVDIGKSANDHESIIRAAITKSECIGSDFLVFSGTSDNEPSVSLGLDQFLNFSGSRRCVCHTIALAVYDSVAIGDFLDMVLTKIYAITTFVSHHKEVSTKLVELQCKQYSRDRTVYLHKAYHTRWHSKLSVLENYVAIKPFLQKVLPGTAPLLLDTPDKGGVAACIDVIREVQLVSRLLEADREVPESLLPQKLQELCEKLHIISETRCTRNTRINAITKPHKSSSKYDDARDKARLWIIDNEDALLLTSKILNNIMNLLGHLFEPVFQFDAGVYILDLDEDDKKFENVNKLSLFNSVLLLNTKFHLDWFPQIEDKKKYFQFTYNKISKK